MNKIKRIWNKYFGLSYKDRTFITSKGSFLYNSITAIVKLILGYVFMSMFFVISGMYSAGLAVIRLIYLSSSKETKKEERKYFLMMNIVLLITCLIYIFNNIRYVVQPEIYSYDILIALGVAIFGIVDLVIAIIGLLRTNQQNDLLFTGIKLVCLTSAFTSLALTQAALLSIDFLNQGLDLAVYISVGSLFFGFMNIVICLVMFVIYIRSRKTIQNLEVINNDELD